jgi:hypothetical protein
MKIKCAFCGRPATRKVAVYVGPMTGEMETYVCDEHTLPEYRVVKDSGKGFEMPEWSPRKEGLSCLVMLV